MNSIRKLSYVLAAVAVVSLATVGCSKDKSGGSAGGGGGASAASMNVLPADANIVVGANVKKITSSKLFEKVKPMILAQGSAEIEKIKSTCNVDPFTAIDSVLIGANQKNSDNAVVLVKGLTGEQVKACAPAVGDGEGVDVVTEGKVTKVAKKDGSDTMYLGWLDDKTMVLAPEAGKDKAKVEALLASTGGVSGNKEMMELIGKVDTGSALWIAGTPDGGAMPMGIEMKAVYGSINLDGGIKLHAGLRHSSAENAQKTADQAKQQLEAIKASPYGEYLKTLEITTDGPDLVVKMSLSDADIDKLMNDPSLKAMIPMMMGGM